MENAKNTEKLLAGYAAAKSIFEGWTKYVALGSAYVIFVFGLVEALKLFLIVFGILDDATFDREPIFLSFLGLAILLSYQNYNLQKYIIQSHKSHEA